MTMVKAFSLKFVILYAAAATSPIFCLSNQKCSFKVPSNPDHTRQWQCKRRIARDTGNIMQSSDDSNPNSIIGHHQRYNSPFNHPLNAHKTPTKLKQTKVFFHSEEKKGYLCQSYYLRYPGNWNHASYNNATNTITTTNVPSNPNGTSGVSSDLVL